LAYNEFKNVNQKNKFMTVKLLEYLKIETILFVAEIKEKYKNTFYEMKERFDRISSMYYSVVWGVCAENKNINF
jgi:hypothetical protein